MKEEVLKKFEATLEKRYSEKNNLIMSVLL